jgi:hypothetical protein
MSQAHSTNSPSDYAELGREIYRRVVEPKTEAAQRGLIAAIDLDTQDFEIASSVIAAADGIRQRHPSARIWFERIGFPALHRIGRFE